MGLSIVPFQKEDLGRINGSHPDRHEHTDYDPEVAFPSDLLEFLPPSAERWWEDVGKHNCSLPPSVPLLIRTAGAARKRHATQNPPPGPQVLLPPRLPKRVRLTFGAANQGEGEKGDEDVLMAIDEEQKVSSESSETTGLNLIKF